MAKSVMMRHHGHALCHNSTKRRYGIDLAANSGCPARCAVLAEGKTVQPPHELGKEFTSCSPTILVVGSCSNLDCRASMWLCNKATKCRSILDRFFVNLDPIWRGSLGHVGLKDRSWKASGGPRAILALGSRQN